MMQKEHRIRLEKLKDLFNVKPTWNIIEHLISEMMNDRIKRNSNDNKTYAENTHTKIDNAIYLLEELKKNNSLSSFQCYKVFKMLLNAERELQYFNDTIGDIKDYEPRRIRALVDKAKPFIVGKIETRIPKNPNTFYNEVYFELIDSYALKKNDALNLLSIIYGKDENSKKAKVPKQRLKELNELKETFIDIIQNGGKDKGFTKQQINNELEEINKLFKNYL